MKPLKALITKRTINRAHVPENVSKSCSKFWAATNSVYKNPGNFWVTRYIYDAPEFIYGLTNWHWFIVTETELRDHIEELKHSNLETYINIPDCRTMKEAQSKVKKFFDEIDSGIPTISFDGKELAEFLEKTSKK